MWDLSSPTRDGTHTPTMAVRHLKHWTTREVPGLHCPVTLWHLLPLGPQTHGAQKPWDLRIHMHQHTPILTPRLPAPGRGPAWTLEGRVGPVGLPREPLLPATLPFAPSTPQALLKRKHPHTEDHWPALSPAGFIAHSHPPAQHLWSLSLCSQPHLLASFHFSNVLCSQGLRAFALAMLTLPEAIQCVLCPSRRTQ